MVKKRHCRDNWTEDVITSLLSQECDTPTKSYLRIIYSFFIEHRERLGYPVDGHPPPYFLASGDLVDKFEELMVLCHTVGIKPDSETLGTMLQALLETYDDDSIRDAGGRILKYHSKPKSRFEGFVMLLVKTGTPDAVLKLLRLG